MYIILLIFVNSFHFSSFLKNLLFLCCWRRAEETHQQWNKEQRREAGDQRYSMYCTVGH